jgi:SAM-dependent methyltransferase
MITTMSAVGGRPDRFPWATHHDAAGATDSPSGGSALAEESSTPRPAGDVSPSGDQPPADNEGILSRPAPVCALCGVAGVLRHAGMRDRLFGVGGIWNFRHCDACDLSWIDPRPTAEGLARLYESYYTHRGPPRPTATGRLRSLFESEVGPAALGYPTRRRTVLGRLVGWLPMLKEVGASTLLWVPADRHGRLLDVGCGDGRLLVALRAVGWDVAGVEPDDLAAAAARDQHGLTVHAGSLDTAPPSFADFDVIVLNHVIEHVADPVATLAEVRSRLRPGGMVVVVTPNLRSLTQQLFHGSWLGWDPPRHLQLFTRASLRECARRAGYSRIEVRTSSRYAFVCWAGSLAIWRRGKVTFDGELAWSLSPGGLSMQALQQLARHWSPDAGEEVLLTASP